MPSPARSGEPDECDLHDLTVEAAMTRFTAHYNQAVAAGRTQPIDVIHGFNQGIAIQISLRNFLAEHTDKLRFVTGEWLDDNPGHTVVYPDKPLPAWQESLAGRVVQFCAQPKPATRIASRFARHGEQRVRDTVDQLVRSGTLEQTTRNGQKCLVAVQQPGLPSHER